MRTVRTSRYLIALPIGMALGIGGAGCSAVGLAIGTAVDHQDRVTVPVDSVESLDGHQSIYLVLSDGRTIAGALRSSESPDSIALDCRVDGSARSPFYGSIERRSFHRSVVDHYEVPRRAYRYGGLALGACIDATFLAIALHSINGSHWDPGKLGKSAVRP